MTQNWIKINYFVIDLCQNIFVIYRVKIKYFRLPWCVISDGSSISQTGIANLKGAPIYFSNIFFSKLHENKDNWGWILNMLLVTPIFLYLSATWWWFSFQSEILYQPIGGFMGALICAPPLHPIFFSFMQFLETFGRMIGLCPLLKVGALPPSLWQEIQDPPLWHKQKICCIIRWYLVQ